MAFADWKKRSRLYLDLLTQVQHIELTVCCQAAYKAGERQGRKDAEEMARRAIALRRFMGPAR